MATPCGSCGKETDDFVNSWPRCMQCQQEIKENDPIIFQYIGGMLGSLPNKRSISHFLTEFTLAEDHGDHSVWIMDDANTLSGGNIAVNFNDKICVVVNGYEEYHQLILNITEKDGMKALPNKIKTDNKSWLNAAHDARVKAGMTGLI